VGKLIIFKISEIKLQTASPIFAESLVNSSGENSKFHAHSLPRQRGLCDLTSEPATLFAGQHEAAHADAQDSGHAAAPVRLAAVARPRRVAARRLHAPPAAATAAVTPFGAVAPPPPPPPAAPRAPDAVGADAAAHVVVAASAADVADELQQQQLERRHDGGEGLYPHPRLAPQPQVARPRPQALSARRRHPHGQTTFW